MAKNSLLDLILDKFVNLRDQTPFINLINERVDQWRSLVIDMKRWESILAKLRAHRPPKLERLHIVAGCYAPSRGGEITLFGGHQATGLKDFKLTNAAIQRASLRLLGLKALHLEGIPSVSATEIINIITESPFLKVLHLSRLSGVVILSESEAGQLDLNSLPPIRLPVLNNLHLIDLPSPFVDLLLAILITPQLRRLDISCRLDEPPATDFLARGMEHLRPTFHLMTANSDAYEVTLSTWRHYNICIGGFTFMTIFSGVLSVHNFQGTLIWLSNQLDIGLADLPLHLNLENCNPDPSLLEWFTLRTNVTELTLDSHRFFGLNLERIFPFLSRPTPPPPASIWLLDQVQILNLHLTCAEGNPEIVDMIENRHFATWGQSSAIGQSLPKRFREIRFNYRGKGDIPPPQTEAFLSKVVRVAGGADVYWKGRKWTAAIGGQS
ncbi:hypothetical protein FRC01_012937 [Tulasnella sp. 417]|nr:hypothetical protein FRC01_012937 [Tulasnella sp. 417]